MELNTNDINIQENNNSYYSQSGEVKNISELEKDFQSNIEKQRKEAIQKFKEYLHNRFGDRFLEDMYRFDFDYVNGKLIWLNRGEVHGIFKYSESRGPEFYFSQSGLKGSEVFNYGLEQSGHEYIDGEFYKDGELIPQFLENGEVNPKYIIALDNINFYRDLQSYYGALKTLWSGGNINYSIESFHRGTVSGVVRIKDLMEYKSHGYISDEEFPQLLARAIQELPSQCSDMRFYKNASGTRLGAEVTKAEIDEYLNPTSGNPLITQEVYNDCLRRIEVRDEKILQRNNIETQTRGSLEVERQRNSFTNKVLNILN